MNSNHAVVRAWAAQTYDGAPWRDVRSAHIFFRDSTIYSYGEHFPMARHHAERGVTLVTSRRYSVTTARHLSLVRGVVRGARVEVPHIGALDASEIAANVAYLAGRVREADGKVASARKHTAWRVRELAEARQALYTYCRAFALKTPKIEYSKRALVKMMLAKLQSVEHD